jgi:hypothetical protein
MSKMPINCALQIWQIEDRETAIPMCNLRNAIRERFEKTENDRTSDLSCVRKENASLQDGKQSGAVSMFLLPGMQKLLKGCERRIIE